MGTHVALDDYGLEAYADYIVAVEQIRDATARKDKARDALITFLRLNNADTADANGRPVLRLDDVDRETVDTKQFKKEEPFIYRRFIRTTHCEYLRSVDSAG